MIERGLPKKGCVDFRRDRYNSRKLPTSSKIGTNTPNYIEKHLCYVNSTQRFHGYYEH